MRRPIKRLLATLSFVPMPSEVLIGARWVPVNAIARGALLGFAIGLGLVAGGFARPGSAIAADSVPSAQILIDDAPFTRNRVVEVVVVPDPIATAPAVIEVRVANSPTVVDGVLAGTTTGQRTWWALADGPDGIRTIYAQLKFQGGAWSPVASAEVELDQSPASSIFFDLPDGAFHDSTTGAPEPDWHERSATPLDRIFASGLVSSDPAVSGFTVADAHWGVVLYHRGNPVMPGMMELTAAPPSQSCGTTCLTVTSRNGGCSGAGWIDIVEIAYQADGDLERLDADYRFVCGPGNVMAGSIRYGSSRATIAIDVAPERFLFAQGVVGETPVDDTITYTNIGTVENAFGQAVIDGDAAGDYSILDDECSGQTIAVNESCAVTLRFRPSTNGYRFARLHLPDETASGERSARVLGHGYIRVGLDLDVEAPAEAPGVASVVVTMTPSSADGAVLEVDGGQRFGPSEVVAGGPSRREHHYEVPVAPGSHHFEAHYQGGGFFLYPEAVTVDIEVPDSGEPWGFMQVGNGSSTTSRSVVVTALPLLLPIATIALSNDGASWTERTLWTYQQDWVLSPGNGTKTVYLKWHDGPTDTWSAVQSATIKLEAPLPTATGPTNNLLSNTSLASGKIPIRLTWSGQTSGSSLIGFDLQQSTDGGAYTAAWTGSSTTLNRNLSPGHSYRFRIRARDTTGNTGLWAYGSTFRLTAVSQASSLVKYAGTWATSTSSLWWGGTARTSSRTGSTVSYAFWGKSIAWVGLKGVGRGKANVYIDGVWKATVDLYSATTLKQRVVWLANYPTSATRRITIKVLGTSGRPRVDIDGFIVRS